MQTGTRASAVLPRPLDQKSLFLQRIIVTAIQLIFDIMPDSTVPGEMQSMTATVMLADRRPLSH